MRTEIRGEPGQGRVHPSLVLILGSASLAGLGGCGEVFSYYAYPEPYYPPAVVVVECAPCPAPRVVEYRSYGARRHW